MEKIMEETLGIPTKHLQWAAVQVLALNFRLVSLGPGSCEAAAAQSFSQAHYHLHDWRAGESLSFADCLSVGRVEIPPLTSLAWHPSASAVWGWERFCLMHSFWREHFILLCVPLPPKAGHLCISAQGQLCTFCALEPAVSDYSWALWREEQYLGTG